MRTFFCVLGLLLFISCVNDSETDQDASKTPDKKDAPSETEKCKYGQPVAIFSEKLEQIKKQSFEVTGQKGIETVEFEDGRYLELYQSGCNEIRQEYRFTIKGEFQDQPDAFWFAEAIKQLTYLGQMDERYAVIGIWVGALERIAGDMKIAEFKEAEPNTFIMVDKVVETGASMVIIVLEARV